MALTWRGPGGLLRSALVEPGARLRVEVDRGRPQAILALPSSAGRGLRPAGAIYPGNAGGQLALDWRGGYEASLALALLGGGVDPWLFNLGRLVDEALARCGDPWLLPVLDVAQALADRSFRIDLYRRMPSFALRLPGIGSWAPESPFAPAPVGEGEGSTVTLGEGLWRFLGPSEELLVSVDAEGGAVFVRRPSPGP